MSAPRDLDRKIQSFLVEGPLELPDPSYDQVRSRMEKTRQRAFIGPWRTPDVNRYLKIGLTAAAVVVIAVVGVQFLGDFNVGGPGPSASESAPGSVTPSAADDCGPTGLGYFDVDAFEELFGQGFTRQTAVNGNVFYQADAGNGVDYVFVIDPDRGDNAIIAASNRINDVREPVSAAAQEDLDLWFSTIGACQPSAVEWIQLQLDDFMAAPGAEIRHEMDFADGPAVKASFTTPPDLFGNDAGKYYEAKWTVEAIAP